MHHHCRVRQAVTTLCLAVTRPILRLGGRSRSGGCSGGRWGRIGGRSELVKSFLPAHARPPARARDPSRRCPQACDRVASKRFTDLAPFVAHGQHFRTVAIARRRNDQILSPIGDKTARWWMLTTLLDGRYGVFRDDRSDRPYLRTFCRPWSTFSCAMVAAERRPTRSEAMRTNGKRSRWATPSHETVAVSPSTECQFSFAVWGQ